MRNLMLSLAARILRKLALWVDCYGMRLPARHAEDWVLQCADWSSDLYDLARRCRRACR